MLAPLLQRLSESPRRWLIVTGVTSALALASVLPQVDELIAERTERAELQEQLASALRSADTLPKYRERATQETGKRDALRGRTVGEAEVASLRTWLVGAARQAGCQVRRIDLAAPSVRPWSDNDNPLETPAIKAPDAPFQLETRAVTFSVTGSEAEVMALLKSIDEDPRLKHPSTMDLTPAGRGAGEMQLDSTIWYFALAKPAKPAA